MMKQFSKGLGMVVMITLLLSSCAKEDEIKGCMDITASNYDEQAEVSAPCTFEETTLPIYADSLFAAWDDNSFAFFPCVGSYAIINTDDEEGAMALVADSAGLFYGFFQTLNVHEGRYYSGENAKLNFRAKLTQTGQADSLGVFIRGTEPESMANCFDVLASGRQKIATNSMSTTIFSSYSLSLQGFDDLYLQNVGVVCGFEFQTQPFDTLMIINDVTWTNY